MLQSRYRRLCIKLNYKPVEETYHRVTEETYHIQVEDTVIVTTAEDPFWVIGKGWVESRDLKAGDRLVNDEGIEYVIEKIEIKQETIRVYNFSVGDYHTYFVTGLKLWTHNCGGSGGRGAGGGAGGSGGFVPRIGGGGGTSLPKKVTSPKQKQKPVVNLPQLNKQLQKAIAQFQKNGSKETGNSLVKDTGNISKNTANLRSWAKRNGWVRQDTAGGVEQWGVRDATGKFSWRLKLKPKVSTREGLGTGSNQPHFDARLDDKGTSISYINPCTGKRGGTSVGTHIPLGK
ncbi:polymorphic toxin-type HINT domain-containing protein [Paenibacillus solani]|uniref:polymorphic toxin-type HINT domain-containing protein n=1 Tax=Paenibacillus solani TaxID=1705565 RepID=UPI003D26578A